MESGSCFINFLLVSSSLLTPTALATRSFSFASVRRLEKVSAARKV